MKPARVLVVSVSRYEVTRVAGRIFEKNYKANNQKPRRMCRVAH